MPRRGGRANAHGRGSSFQSRRPPERARAYAIGHTTRVVTVCPASTVRLPPPHVERSSLNEGDRPVTRYLPAGNSVTNRPLLPTGVVTVSDSPANFTVPGYR